MASRARKEHARLPLLAVAITVLLVLPSFLTSAAPQVLGAKGIVSASSSAATTTTTGCTNPSVTPPGGLTCKWLTKENLLWKPLINSSVGWEVEFTRASYDNIGSSSPAVLQAELTMLLSSGTSCIRIDIGYDPWITNNATTQSQLDSEVSQIRAAGKCLVIADGAAEVYRQYPLPWANFQQAWGSRVQTLAQRYQPDFYIVIKEPGWYAPMVSDSTTNPQFVSASAWVQLANGLAGAVQAVSPGTKIGVSVSAAAIYAQWSFYRPFLTGVQSLPSLSIVGFDIYNQAGFVNTQAFLGQYGTGGKSIWLAEAWSATAMSPSFYAFNPTRASLDRLWVQSLYFFAVDVHASAVSAFYSDCFSSYTWSSDSGSIVSTYKLRTPVFNEFHQLATTYGGVVK